MGLTVLNVAYPFAPVGPDAVGGAEQILSQLDYALVGAGHRSIVVACEGSKTAGTLIATPSAEGVLSEEERQRVRREHRQRIVYAMERHSIDVIHLHGIDFLEYLPPEGAAALITLHLPLSWYPAEVFELSRAETYLHCVSASQRRGCPACGQMLGEIENGVAMEGDDRLGAKQGYALALGRICPEKNFQAALDAGVLAGVPVLLGGQVFPYAAHEEYFRREIVPRLDGMRRFLGPVGAEEKRRLLAEARCLLVPSVVAETSSLVAMEAMARGTPVIAYPAGALPEIVEEGVTGFIVQNEREMAEAIGAVGELKPEVCRAVARERFSLGRMVGQYFEAYRRLAGGGGGVCSKHPATCALDRALSGSSDETTAYHPAARGSSRVAWASRPCHMRVEEIPTIEGLERIGGEWGELWGKSGMGTPFQSPWWLIPWWRHIGEGELWTLAFREESDAGQGGRLVGLLPLYIYTRPGTRIRKLFLLGISSSDYLDALVLPEYAGRVMAAAMEYLDAHRERWDVCDLQQLAAGSPLCDMTVPAGWVEKSSESEPCLVVSLAEGMGGLDCCVPGTMVQNLRYYRRRAERQGTWQVEGADSHNVEEMLEALLRLHRARWSMRSMPGVLDQAGVEGFHREAVGGLLSAGMLRLYGLRFEGRLISVLYGLFDPREWGRRFYYYLGGFDPGYERLSPGTLVIGHAMEQAAGEGAREFDFLRGCERYKYLWGAKNTATYRRRLWHAARQASDVMPELQCCDDRS